MRSLHATFPTLMLLLAVLGMCVGTRGVVLCHESSGNVTFEWAHGPASCSNAPAQRQAPAIDSADSCSDTPLQLHAINAPSRHSQVAHLTLLSPTPAVTLATLHRTSPIPSRLCRDALTGSPPKPPLIASVVLLL